MESFYSGRDLEGVVTAIKLLVNAIRSLLEMRDCTKWLLSTVVTSGNPLPDKTREKTQKFPDDVFEIDSH